MRMASPLARGFASSPNLLRAALASLAVVYAATVLPNVAHAQNAELGRSVDSLLASARDTNPELAAMRSEAKAASERITQAGALPDPRLRLELQDITRGDSQGPTINPGDAGSARYTITQELPWFGKRDLRRESSQFEAAAAQSRTQGVWTDIAARIKATYAQLYLLRHIETLDREILELMGRLEKIALARYAGGLTAQQDALKAQTEQTSMRNELITVQSDKRQAQARMNALLSRPSQSPLSEPEALRALPSRDRLDFPALEAKLRENNPYLASDDLKLKAAEKTRDLAYKNRYPDFTIGVAPTQYQSSFKTWDLMFEVSIPLQQESRRAQEHEAESMIEAARSRKEANLNQALADLSENLAAMESSRQTTTLIEESLLPQAELTLQSALSGYENGKVDFSTVIDAQRQIRQSKQALFKAQAEGQARLAQIERLLGEDL
jgi:cobalt-zinc-cadmium efflux system outer membrane protein